MSRLAVVLAGPGSEHDAVLSISSLLMSSFQDFRVNLFSELVLGNDILSTWVDQDERFVWDAKFEEFVANSEAVLILPVGLLLTEYSLEALFEALQVPEVSVVRALVPSRHSSLEFWDAGFIRAVGCENSELSARQSGSERWMDGAAIGLHYVGQPAPRVFFRRGAADRHIVDVNVFESAPGRIPLGTFMASRRRIRAAARRIKVLPERLRRMLSNG
ncbi:hypothetical protein [Arthrobacter wenxiniae]|uniref:Uncharacterized protein n=1 Tax=Arthrobacter wenxiniae TaxID=2713570 RepID=A0A7Y7LZD1_9MICC|nr:hypothetical protein [Arthrobacter wenxiniae]NVM94854.1 hypothetical protein [Arthrobacter wenxiniae]